MDISVFCLQDGDVRTDSERWSAVLLTRPTDLLNNSFFVFNICFGNNELETDQTTCVHVCVYVCIWEDRHNEEEYFGLLSGRRLVMFWKELCLS